MFSSECKRDSLKRDGYKRSQNIKRKSSNREETSMVTVMLTKTAKNWRRAHSRFAHPKCLQNANVRRRIGDCNSEDSSQSSGRIDGETPPKSTKINQNPSNWPQKTSPKKKVVCTLSDASLLVKSRPVSSSLVHSWRAGPSNPLETRNLL